MTRKFLFCFPLRIGNVIFGYVVIAVAIAVVAYNLYEFGVSVVAKDEDRKFENFDSLEQIFGQNKTELVKRVSMTYYISYIVVGMLLFLFAAMFTVGAYRANYCLVTTFFVYCFIHMFLSIGLIAFEATTTGWIQLGLLIGFDVLLIICLFSVKNLMEAIRTGKIYSHPEDVLYKY